MSNGNEPPQQPTAAEAKTKSDVSKDRKGRITAGGVWGTGTGTGTAWVVYKACAAYGIALSIDEAILLTGVLAGWGATISICAKQIRDFAYAWLEKKD